MATKKPTLMGGLGKRITGRNKKDEESNESGEQNGAAESDDRSRSRNSRDNERNATKRTGAFGSRRAADADDDENGNSTVNGESEKKSNSRPNVFQRIRERSRSRSRSRSLSRQGGSEGNKEMLVAVTSCRSDGYYNQKAPGTTSKLPRKAPTNLKLFHELAVGVKDAYAAVGATPKNPTEEEKKKLEKVEVDARFVLWDFIGNLDFVSYCKI